MAFCSSCGTKLDDGAKFCPSCGTPAGGAAPSAPPPPKTDKGGEAALKCPSCGTPIKSMTGVCPECGYEFRGVQVASSVQAFFEKIDAVDAQVFERGTAKEKTEDGVAGTVKGVLGAFGLRGGQSASEIAAAGDERKLSLIEGYPIPNSKEDIMEFVIMAASRIKDAGSLFKRNDLSEKDINFNKAWKTKCEQAYAKAKIVCVSDTETLNRITSILKEKKVIK